MGNQTLVNEICPTTAQVWIQEGALLIDVRENEEVAELAFDLPNIVLIPLSQFEERYQEIPKNHKVIMVCKSGNRSLRAAGFLVNHGYENVVNMQHGMVRWVEKGFSIKGNAAAAKNSDGGCCSSSCC